MTRNTLICTAFGLAFGLFSEATDAQNAQCTLVTGSKAGQVVPVTINPAPPLNASCSVGSDRGYVSRTSGAVCDTNAVCTITVSGRTLNIPYCGNPAPALNAVCNVAGFRGSISRTSAATNSGATNLGPGCQCTLFTGPNAGKAFPYDGALPLASACKVGADRGYISRTSLDVTRGEIFGGKSNMRNSLDPNFVCTVQVNGRTWNVPSVSIYTPAVGDACQAGGVAGHVSSTVGH
jgi:hypothetical protein